MTVGRGRLRVVRPGDDAAAVTAIRSGTPLAVSPLWRAVITDADGQCQCSGVCGSRHRDGRCRANLAAGRQLVVAPADPRVPVDAAWRVRERFLAAWCGPCLDAARRRARRAEDARPRPAAQAPTQQLDLLGLCGGGEDPQR